MASCPLNLCSHTQSEVSLESGSKWHKISIQSYVQLSREFFFFWSVTELTRCLFLIETCWAEAFSGACKLQTEANRKQVQQQQNHKLQVERIWTWLTLRLVLCLVFVATDFGSLLTLALFFSLTGCFKGSGFFRLLKSLLFFSFSGTMRPFRGISSSLSKFSAVLTLRFFTTFSVCWTSEICHTTK